MLMKTLSVMSADALQIAEATMAGGGGILE